MSRFELGGFGEEIPLEALPGPVEGDLRPLTYNLPDGTIFLPADFMAFGYTHYEVICIGGEGGHGSQGGPIGGWPYSFVGSVMHWGAPNLAPSNAHGGAGGGGGLHRVAGRLDELPEEVLVIVGEAGTNAPIGYIPRGDPWNDPPVPYTPTLADAPGPGVYDGTGTTFYAPTDGEDGGASSFGEIAQASGGKGGGPITIIDPEYVEGSGYHVHAPGGNGGDGGIGGQLEAGGGAAGGQYIPYDPPGSDAIAWNTAEPETGDWDGDIGEGGGGGRGGNIVINTYTIGYSA